MNELKKEITAELRFTLIKKERTTNDHGDPFHALYYRVDMPGRTLFLEPIHVGFHAIDKMDETYLRTLLIDAMPWRR